MTFDDPPPLAPGPSIAGSDPAKLSLGIKILLGAGPVAGFLLALQAAAPLTGGVSAPWLFNAAFCAIVYFLLAYFALVGSSDERLLAFMGIVGLTHVLAIDGLFSVESDPERASLLAATLSATWSGFALLGLLHTFALLGTSYLLGRALLHLARAEEMEPWLAKSSAFLVSVVVGVVGLRALMGYATGSTSLFL